jgi:hypothetical protein
MSSKALSKSLLPDFKLSRWFIENTDPAVRCWHRVDVGSVANVSEENAVSIFRGEVCRIGIQ